MKNPFFLLIFLVIFVFGFDNVTKIETDHLADEKVISEAESKWRLEAIRKLWAERRSMSHTPLITYNAPGFPATTIYLKNETATPTRTLKHRFAWALLLWAITERHVTSQTSAIYDSTSGNTGSAEAYMSRLVGIPYIAIVADNLEPAKVRQIEQFGGKVEKVPVSRRNLEARQRAAQTRGFYMNQFGNAAKAEEFHESGGFLYESSNVFHEILVQIKPIIPDFFVHAAGTGGTISSVGRYITRYGAPTRVVLSDSQFSLFYDYVLAEKFTNQSGKGIWKAPGVAGIGYGYDIEPVIFGETTSLVRNVIDEAVKMPDIATVAATRILNETGFNFGPSTALNFLVSLYKAYQNTKKSKLVITTLANDPGDYYSSTYLNDTWIEQKFENVGGINGMKCWKKIIENSIETGSDFYSLGLKICQF